MSAITGPSNEIAAERLCAACGYDLRGLTELRCPECGLAFSRTYLPPINIPWTRRERIGLWRAYFLTVWMFFIHPRRWQAEIVRTGHQIDADGDSFRKMTVIVASTSIASTSLIVSALSVIGVRNWIAVATTSIAFFCTFTFFYIATITPTIEPSEASTSETRLRFSEMQKFCCSGLSVALFLPMVAIGERIFIGTPISLSAANWWLWLSQWVVVASWLAGWCAFMFCAVKARIITLRELPFHAILQAGVLLLAVLATFGVICVLLLVGSTLLEVMMR